MELNTKELVFCISTKLLTANTYYNSSSATQAAWWFIEWITKSTKLELITKDKIALTKEQHLSLEDAIYQHIFRSKPLQYIFGSVQFLDLNIAIKEPILIPRPETEEWCQETIEHLKALKNKKLNILDLCSGSGCIGLSFAKAFKESKVFLLDISKKACELAKENSQINSINNIKVIESDLYSNLPNNTKFDLILSNPPYIDNKDWQNLDLMVKSWEDINALVAKDNGLDIIQKITRNSKNYIKYNKEFINNKVPQLIIEIGYNQNKLVKNIFKSSGLTNIAVKKDFCGNYRLVTGELDWKEKSEKS